jgi:hypothetical protein
MLCQHGAFFEYFSLQKLERIHYTYQFAMHRVVLGPDVVFLSAEDAYKKSL